MKSFTSKDQINAHIQKHHHEVDIDTKFTCDHCGQFFAQISILQAHIENIHLNSKNSSKENE